MLQKPRMRKPILSDFHLFLKEFSSYITKKLRVQFNRFEWGKGKFVTILYKQRGKMGRRFMHSGMAGIGALSIMIAPIIAQEFPQNEVDPWESSQQGSVLAVQAQELTPSSTIVSEKVRGDLIEYTVEEGDTISTIAEKFGVSEETIKWQNELNSKGTIKVGQTLEILPVTGIMHKVKKGETVHSIAKKYDTSAQAIVDWPFNSFTNDETFELAIGQNLVVPDGVMPSASGTTTAPSRIRQITPNAGTVVASGQFVWPTNGSLTQGFAWYHKGIDIANRASPNVLAADSGTVVVAGWPDGYGYGNRVIIDHGNGYKTLYAHLSSIYVVSGQTVARGAAVGRMGTTGRSTGIHLHFEVIKNGVHISPYSVLQ